MERLGVIGKPSDWLIASCVKKQDVERLFGMQVVDIPMDEVLSLDLRTEEALPTQDETGKESADHE